MPRIPKAGSILILLPVTVLSFFLTAALWGIVGPLLFPALRTDERMMALLSFYPIELLGILGPVLYMAKNQGVDRKLVFPFRKVPALRLLLILGATIGLGLVITYLQAWFARLTGLTYPAGISDMIRARQPREWLVLITGVAMVPAFAEEMITRGYIQSALVPRFGLWVGILLTAALFALLHFTPAGIPTYLALGIWLSWVRERTRSLWGNILAHTTNNLIAVSQANFVPEGFWQANLAWVFPLGLALFAGFGFLALRETAADQAHAKSRSA